MKAVFFLIPFLPFLTACNHEQASNPEPPPNKASAVEVAAGSTNYLDFKNGFRDVIFGQRAEDIKDLVLITQMQGSGYTLAAYQRTTDVLSLNNVPLTEITYSFLNDEFVNVLITWGKLFTNTAEVDVADVTPTTGIRNHKYFIGFPTGLEDFTESLFGKPSRIETKESGKEVTMRSTRAEWYGNSVGLIFYEGRLAGYYPDNPPQTLGSIEIFDVPKRMKVEQLAKEAEANEAASKRDGL